MKMWGQHHVPAVFTHKGRRALESSVAHTELFSICFSKHQISSVLGKVWSLWRGNKVLRKIVVVLLG